MKPDLVTRLRQFDPVIFAEAAAVIEAREATIAELVEALTMCAAAKMPGEARSIAHAALARASGKETGE